MRGTRREFLVAAVATVGGLAGCAGDSGGDGTTTDTTTESMDASTDSMETTDGMATTTGGMTTTTTASSGPAWLTTEMEDVTSGETFTVAGLAEQRPVLLETFAVWCHVCDAQQESIKEFRQQHGDVALSVAVNVDPNESRDKVLEHVQQNGYDWRYTIAPPQVSTNLASAFGQSMLNPPSAPMVVVCRPEADAATRLDDGVKGVDALLSAVEGC